MRTPIRGEAAPEDWRQIANGWEIPAESYCDQPYIVQASDGAWVCVMTTGAGREGQPGQHIVARRSMDQGRSWSAPIDVESAEGPESSYAVALRTPYGRIYCFYNHNSDNLRWVKADPLAYKDGKCARVDTLGYYVFKYSDDGGRTWSAERHVVPVREFAIDRENEYGGRIRFFWNVGRPFTHRGAAFLSLHKVGGFGYGFMRRSEGVLIRSDNLLTERDPERLRWETLPEGDAGLRAPEGGGWIAEEHSYSVLSDGAFFCVYRTIAGHPAWSISRDEGRTWTPPAYLRYGDGRLVRHPRAANFAWKLSNGKFLYWFHNHGGAWYEDRNPAWVLAGAEADGPDGREIRWSQPEILLYDDDPFIRMSYPDLVEENGRCFVSETQKSIARVHAIPAAFLDGLCRQFDELVLPAEAPLIEWSADGVAREIEAPLLPEFARRGAKRADYGTEQTRAGFSICLRARFGSLAPGQILLDNRTAAGQGFAVRTTERETVELVMNDGRSESRWDCDPGAIEAQTIRHLAILVDGGPRIASFVVDGRFCDGGDFRQFGWGRFSPWLRHANGGKTLRLAPAFEGELLEVRIYGRALAVFEAIGDMNR
ncbi:MAG: hypothetical protein BWZ10_00200 [candidate division BRC1 bacterium ADurb.BinA364]|nr:MAG: hypothetical protein BWZ10_00200 [candidate division BRC1 bacterium ADurb.BinA364]